LVVEGVSPDAILATTFTRKAAGEILGRVLSNLALAAHDEATCRRIAEQMNLPGLSYDRATCLLRETVRSLHRLRVSTLDAFFLQLAGTFAWELGLPQSWHIAEPNRVEQLRREAIRELFRQRPDDLRKLVPLLAKGAASRGIASLMHDQVRQLYGEFLGTTEEAWQRIRKLTPVSAEELNAALAGLENWQPFSNRKVEKARKSDLFQFRAKDWAEFLGKGIAGKIADGKDRYQNVLLPEEFCALYQPLVQHASEQLVLQIARWTEATYELLKAFDEQYAALARDQGVLGFDDVARILALSREIAPGDQVAWRLDGQIEHLLLDEFQDTSPAQWNVLEPFSQHVTRHRERCSFFCVGDVKQAIYGWRGGVAEIFDAIEQELEGVSSASLAESRRSAQAVIDTVNLVFLSLLGNPALEGLSQARERWAQRFEKHSTAKRDLNGYCRVEFAPRVEKGENQLAKTFQTAAEQIEAFARRAPDCSVGVLVRKNANIVPLIQMLQRRGIHASEEGGNPLTDSAAVAAMLSALTLAEHPGNRVARHHVAESPLGRVLRLSQADDAREAQRVAREIREEIAQRGYGPVLSRWAEQVRADCTSREWRRLEQLVDVAFRCPIHQYPRPADFIERVETLRVEDPSASQVRVMTIHQSKGLEFDLVVLPDLEGSFRGQPPTVVTKREKPAAPVTAVCRYAKEVVRPFLSPEVQQMHQDHLRNQVCEAICLLYVAMTRAVSELRVVLSPPKCNENTMPKSPAGLIRSALGGCVKAPLDWSFETGDPAWLEKQRLVPQKSLSPAGTQTPLSAETAARPIDGKETIPRATGETLSLRSDPGRRRMLPRVSPSSLEGGTQVQLARWLQLERPASLLRGSLFHSWFQTIEWLDEKDEADWPMRRSEFLELAQKLRAPRDEVSAWLEEFQKMLERPALREALVEANYRQRFASLTAQSPRLEVWRERPFAVADSQGLLTGTLDRVVVFCDGTQPLAAEVLDYKTDVISDPQARNARVDFYRPQLEAYRRAVGRLCHLSSAKITAKLLFVDSGDVCPV
jgi:ATP-dependent exoDNAse (exonuclease V) beta subunit